MIGRMILFVLAVFVLLINFRRKEVLRIFFHIEEPTPDQCYKVQMVSLVLAVLVFMGIFLIKK